MAPAAYRVDGPDRESRGRAPGISIAAVVAELAALQRVRSAGDLRFASLRRIFGPAGGRLRPQSGGRRLARLPMLAGAPGPWRYAGAADFDEQPPSGYGWINRGDSGRRFRSRVDVLCQPCGLVR